MWYDGDTLLFFKLQQVEFYQGISFTNNNLAFSTDLIHWSYAPLPTDMGDNTGLSFFSAQNQLSLLATDKCGTVFTAWLSS